MDDPANANVVSSVAVLGVRHFFGEGWSVEAELPAGMVRYRANRTPAARSTGFGDLRLLGRYDFAALLGPGGYTPSVTLALGVGLPTGRTETLRVLGVAPSQLSVGTGAFSADAGLFATQFVHKRFALRGNVALRAPLTATAGALQLPSSFSYGAGGLVLLGDTALSLDINGTTRGRAVELEVGTVLRSGGTIVALAAGVSQRVHERVTLAVTGRLPVWRDVNGPQVSERFTVGAAVVVAFGGAAAEAHEHGHDHGDEHGHDHGDEHGHDHGDAHDRGASSASASESESEPASDSKPVPGSQAELESDARSTSASDSKPVPRPAFGTRTKTVTRTGQTGRVACGSRGVCDLTRGGATFDRETVAVRARVTVIDFWAEWCAPCHDLDRRLRALADSNGDLLVKRVEVPSFDHPVAREHLASATQLPVLWIFDRDGEGPTVLSGAPDDLVAAVRRALQR